MINFALKSLLLLGIVAGTTACSNHVDVRPLESSIKAELEKQGGIIVQIVMCPKDVPKAKDTFFQCKGKLVPRGEFVADVQQEDEAGKLKWEILNSNGLLNLPRLEKRLQKEIGTEIGTEPTIKCSSGTRQYRPTKPGDSFDCRVTNGKLTNPQGQIDKLTIKIDPVGNLSWQQFRTVQVVATPTPSLGASPRATAAATASKPGANTNASPTSAATPAADPAAKPGEEFLKQNPNATDGFD
jgi:hypothetical protein